MDNSNSRYGAQIPAELTELWKISKKEFLELNECGSVLHFKNKQTKNREMRSQTDFDLPAEKGAFDSYIPCS